VKQIAFFDLDGTITTRDTLLEFLKFSKGSFYFYCAFLLYSPILVAYKLKIISNQTAKEKVLSFFFKKMPLPGFRALCHAFATEGLPGLLRPKALKEIKQLQSRGIQVVIVSASLEEWIRPWTDSIGAELVATRPEIKDEKLTGKFQGRNCYGDEKVARIKDSYNLSLYDKIYAYGDTSADKPMLRLATISFYKPFR
jgi:HAD superfamily hydrolase (TIGR01490 family)